MGSFSVGHWAIVLVIVLLLFGSNRLSSLMGDAAKGVKAFKKGLQDSEDPAPLPGRPVDALADAAGKPMARGENA